MENIKIRSILGTTMMVSLYCALNSSVGLSLSTYGEYLIPINIEKREKQSSNSNSDISSSKVPPLFVYPNRSLARCNENEFKCSSLGQNPGVQCLANHYQCDNKKDCYDGADEDPKMCQFVDDLNGVHDLAGRLRSNGADVCSVEFVTAKPRLLIVVDSEAERSERRRKMRRRFRSYQEYFTGRARVVFFVSAPRRNQTLAELLRREIDEHADVVLTDVWQPHVRSGHFRSVRTMSALNWALANCGRVRYVLKASDAVDINVSAVVQLVRSTRNKKNTVWKFNGIPQPKNARYNCWSSTPYMMTIDAVKKLFCGALKPMRYVGNDVDFLTKVVASNENVNVLNHKSWKLFVVDGNVC